MGVIVKKNTAVNRAGAAAKKAAKNAIAVKGRAPDKRSDLMFAGKNIAIRPGAKAAKAGGSMARKARKGK